MADAGRALPVTAGGVTLAVAMMLAANGLFATVDTSTKWLLGAGLVSVQLAFMRYAVQFAITCIDLGRADRARLAGIRPLLPLLLLRAALLVGATVVNFFALKFLSLTVTSAIMFTAPIIVCALSWPLLGERVGTFRWTAVAFGFAGVLIVIRPFGEGFQWAAAMMLLPATGLAFYSILTRRLAGDVDASAMQFVVGLMGTMVLAPFAVAVWANPQTPLDWGLMLGLGAFAWAGHELLIRAHARAEANFLMPYTYSYLLFMAAAAFVVFGDVPDAATGVGALMIAGAGLAIWHRRNRQAAHG